MFSKVSSLIDQRKYPPLNLQPFDAKIKSANGVLQVFDRIRGKFLVLTPEEWVRQHFIHHLINDCNIPESSLVIESEISYGKMRKRPDIASVDRSGKAWLVIECKAPDVQINEQTWAQALTYFSVLNPSVLVLTNGLKHVISIFQPEIGKFVLIDEIPPFPNPRN